jgi:hypothetical protein
MVASLFCVLTTFLRHSLFPAFQNKQEKYDKISQAKIAISTSELCKGAPQAFKTYLDYTRQLRFTQKPDYKYLRSLFYDLFRANGWKVRQRHRSLHRALPLRMEADLFSSCCFAVQDDCVYDWMLPKGVLPESSPARPGITPQQQAAVTAYQQQSAAVAAQAQAHQAQLAANTAAMMNQYLYARPSTATTPVATPALSRAITPQQQQQQPTLVQMMHPQQPYATPTTTPRAPAAAAATPTSSSKAPAATPSPNPPAAGADPSAELKRRVAQLEKSLEEQRILSSEWKMLFEKGQATNQQHVRDISRLKTENANLLAKLDSLQQQMNDKKDTIPLASAASLKRRRAAAGESAETTNTDDDENSAKKAKTKR